MSIAEKLADINLNQANYRRINTFTPTPFTHQQLNELLFLDIFTIQPSRSSIEVTWRPPLTFLHYNELYHGVYEYLRAPPVPELRSVAVEYLADLQYNYNAFDLIPNVRRLQGDRITWVREWLKAMPELSGDYSDADTVEHE